MIEFLRKLENRSIKIARVNPILITKSINLQLFTLILYDFGVRCDLRRFTVLSQGLLQLQAWVSANGVLKDWRIKVIFDTEYWWNIKICEE